MCSIFLQPPCPVLNCGFYWLEWYSRRGIARVQRAPRMVLDRWQSYADFDTQMMKTTVRNMKTLLDFRRLVFLFGGLLCVQPLFGDLVVDGVEQYLFVSDAVPGPDEESWTDLPIIDRAKTNTAGNVNASQDVVTYSGPSSTGSSWASEFVVDVDTLSDSSEGFDLGRSRFSIDFTLSVPRPFTLAFEGTGSSAGATDDNNIFSFERTDVPQVIESGKGTYAGSDNGVLAAGSYRLFLDSQSIKSSVLTQLPARRRSTSRRCPSRPLSNSSV